VTIIEDLEQAKALAEFDHENRHWLIWKYGPDYRAIPWHAWHDFNGELVAWQEDNCPSERC
jgi:hypothetical protein